ncbi:C-type lectin domain family 7 member A-like [Hypanus sabinus]|uniref:C-type lectin domain family 7 member A-like n=1 Tax=Hypanus sabinus TaxID=79690 RepID=UPI0028C41436|nr:C-type lectin domain family 7 member A-like [Hypanus sabinus]
MDDSETYMNVQLLNTDSSSPSRDGLNPTYSLLNFPNDEHLMEAYEDPPIASGAAEMPVTAQADGLNSTYSVLHLPKEEHLSEVYEDPPISSGPAEMSVAAQAGPDKQEPNENIGNSPDRKICLLCLVTFFLIATVVGLSIHVSQIRQSLKRMNSELRHKFTEMETKYRSVNETKAQICELLTSRREQECPQSWIRNAGGCYFITTLKLSYDKARQYCWDLDSKLLEINSAEEANFVYKAVRDQGRSYWIGKCKDGKFASNVLYRMNGSDPECSVCYNQLNPCDQVQARFICEISRYLCPDIYEMIKAHCQLPEGPT